MNQLYYMHLVYTSESNYNKAVAWLNMPRGRVVKEDTISWKEYYVGANGVVYAMKEHKASRKYPTFEIHECCLQNEALL